MAFDATAMAGVAEYQASLMDAESRFQAAKSRLLSLIRTSMDQVTAATTEAVVTSGGIPSAYTTGIRPNDNTTTTTTNNNELLSPNRLLHSRGGGSNNNNLPPLDPQKQKEMEMEKFAQSLPLLQPVNPRYHKHITTSTNTNNPTNNRNRAASGKRKDDTTNDGTNIHTNSQQHTTDNNTNTTNTTNNKGRSRRLAEGVAYGRAQTANTENGHKENNDDDDDIDEITGNRRKSIDDDLQNNPLNGPAHHNNKHNKEERKPKDFDLRLGPAYNTDMEKLRARQAVEWRAKREEAHTRLVMLSSTLTNKTNPNTIKDNNGNNNTTTTTNNSKTSRSSNPTSQQTNSRSTRGTTDPNDPMSARNGDGSPSHTNTNSMFNNFGVTDNNLPSPPVLFGNNTNTSSNMDWNNPTLSQHNHNNPYMVSSNGFDPNIHGAMLSYDFHTSNPPFPPMFPPGQPPPPMMMDPNGQPIGFINPENGLFMPFPPSQTQPFLPYPSNGMLPGQGFAQTPAGTVSGTQILEHMAAVANTQRRVGTASGRLRSDPSTANTKYQSYDTLSSANEKKLTEQSSAFRNTGKNSSNTLRNMKPSRKSSANKVHKNAAPLAASAFVSPAMINNPNMMMPPPNNNGMPQPLMSMDPSMMMMMNQYPPTMIPMMDGGQENNGDTERAHRMHTGSSDSSDQNDYASNNPHYSSYPYQNLHGVFSTNSPSQPSSNVYPYSPSQPNQKQNSPLNQILGNGNLLNISSQANAIVKYELSINRSPNKDNTPLSPIDHVQEEEEEQTKAVAKTPAPKPYSRVLAPSDAIAAANNRAQAAITASRNNDNLRTPARQSHESKDDHVQENNATSTSRRESAVLDRSFPMASPTSIDSAFSPDVNQNYPHAHQKETDLHASHNDSNSTDISGLDLSTSDGHVADTQPDNDQNSQEKPALQTDLPTIVQGSQVSLDSSQSSDVDEHLRQMMMDQSSDENDIPTAFPLEPESRTDGPTDFAAEDQNDHDDHELTATLERKFNESFDESIEAEEITNLLANEIINEIDTASPTKAIEQSQPVESLSSEPVLESTTTNEIAHDEQSGPYVRSDVVLPISTHNDDDVLEDSISNDVVYNYKHNNPNDEHITSGDLHLELQAQAVEALMWQGPNSDMSEKDNTLHNDEESVNISINNKHSAIIGARGASPINA